MPTDITLTLREAADMPDDCIRLDQADLRVLNITAGDIVSVTGTRTSYAKTASAHMEDRNQGLARLSAALRKNVGAQDGASIKITAIRKEIPIADEVTFAVTDDIDYLHLKVRLQPHLSLWNGRVIAKGDWLRVPTLDRHPLDVKITTTTPDDTVRIGSATKLVIGRATSDPLGSTLAGLRDIYRTCYALANRRLRKSTAWNNACAILLTGPDGCGKAQIAKRVAEEMRCYLRVLDVDALIDRQVDRGSIDVETLFSDLKPLAPAIILLDHIDALNGHPQQHSVVSQLCAMLDELRLHNGFMLFGICSGDIDPRFKALNRFDLIIPIDAPDRLARQEMLELATRNMQLDDSISLSEIASTTRGFTSEDIQRLVTTAELSNTEEIISQHDFAMALRTIPPSALSHVYSDIPDIAWEDVGGLDEVKNLLRETVSWSLHHHAQFAEISVHPPRSILLSGSEGSGKTLIVQAVASAAPLPFIEISCTTLAPHDKTVAASYVRDSFALARRKSPCIVFFDDIDALFEDSMQTDEQLIHHPVIANLLEELDHLSQMPGVVVIAATNRPDRLTNEMMRPGRFDYAVSLPLPDLDARKKIFQIHSRKLPLSADIDFDRLASLTQGFTPANIANACNRVGLLALRQSINADNGSIPPVITQALFEQILNGRK